MEKLVKKIKTHSGLQQNDREKKRIIAEIVNLISFDI